MNTKIIIIIVAAILVCVGIAGGAFWWVQQQQGPAAAPSAPQMDESQYSYVTLDKIVVMLRTEEHRAQNYYMSLDIVFRTDKKHEKSVKSDLPMLKGVAVRTLSQIEAKQAKAMNIDEWTDVLRREVMQAYETRPQMRGFDQIMVSRLIIE